jgi:hypothetical protein
MASATIKLFLAHGDAKRLRTAELSNWSGKAVAGPRVEIESVRNREESESSGIYFLTGTDTQTGKSAVYIGETESIRKRLKDDDHLKREFWNHVIFFISKDESLTKAHIKYLEGRLLDQAKSVGKALVKNEKPSGAKLPESDREDMEIFLEKIHQLLPVLGADFLVPSTHKDDTPKQHLFTCELKGIQATGVPSPSGFVIFKGSQAVEHERPSAHKYPWVINSRKSLITDGILVKEGDLRVFTADYEFPSPSSAAAVIHGGTANGLTAWKNKDGKTLKDLEAE